MGIPISDIFYWFYATSPVSFSAHVVLKVYQIINSCKIFLIAGISSKLEVQTLYLSFKNVAPTFFWLFFPLILIPQTVSANK